MTANHSTNEKKVPAVASIRTSSDKQEASPKQQRDELDKLAKRDSYDIIREYIDEGISGDEIEKRPDFRMMLDDAQELKELGISCLPTRTRFPSCSKCKKDGGSNATNCGKS